MNRIEQAATARADQELRPLQYQETAPPTLSVVAPSYWICVQGGGCGWIPLPAPTWSTDQPLSFDELVSVPTQLMAEHP